MQTRYGQSPWIAGAARAARPVSARLREELDADVVIMGGGLTGVATALACATAGLKPVLLEADSVGHGWTGHSGGLLLPDPGPLFRDVSRAHGLRSAKVVFSAWRARRLDPAFREALGYAIDRDVIIDRAYHGAGDPGLTIIPPAYGDFHWEPPEDEAFTYDPERAAEMLDEAGYTVGDDGFRTLPNGEPIGAIRLFARSESTTSVDVMNFFKEWLADLDIKAEVTAVESNKLTEIILEGNFDTFEWGWFVEPNPTTMLDYMTCDQLDGWNDSWFCNEEYDALHEQQQTETDPAARAEQVRKMQEVFYDETPYLVTAYSAIGEAFRSDRFACLVSQPDPDGVWLMQYGVHNYLNMRPADEAGDCEGVAGATEATSGGADEGVSTGLVVGMAVAAGAVIVVGGVVMMRRRRTVEDRE